MIVASFLRATAPVLGTPRGMRGTRIGSPAVAGGRRCCLFQTHSGLAKASPAGIVLCAAIFLAFCAPARAQYAPEHPEVRAAIDAGLQYLQESYQNETRAGGRALAGMAIVKGTGDADNKVVLECVKATREAYREYSTADKYGDEGMYDMGLCTLFLITADPIRYRRDIDGWMRLLEKWQKPHGGWGYHARESGDTSMTQYGVLACWEAHQAKIPVSPRMANGALSWLLRTQDPSGCFGYQGTLAPSYDQLVQQYEMRITMAAAGLGSVYVLADLFGANGRQTDDNGLPPALKPVGGEDAAAAAGENLKAPVAREYIERAKQRGDAWFAANYSIESKQWQYYYLYALERYQSFRELAENRTDPSPRWYNDGVAYLLKNQSSGSWAESGGNVVDTSFALLFLMRSTRKSIQKARDFGAGLMLSGRGIPKDTDRLTVRDGQVVSLEEVRLTQQLIDAVGSPESINNAETLDAISQLPPKESRVLATQHAEKLRAMLRGDSPEAKVTVAKTLGRSGDLSNVPALILLLSDENAAVVLEARDALRRLSRRFDGFGLTEESGEVERDKAIQAWKDWYRQIEPDVEYE